MTKSLLLGFFVLGLALVCALAVRHYGRKAGQAEGKIRALFYLFVIAGLVASLLAFTVDWRQRQTTLYEALLEGSKAIEEGAAIPVRVADFAVEHPGVEHTLIVQPKLGFGEEATGPVELQIVLADAHGRLLVDEQRSFEVRTEGTGRDPRDFSDGRQVWEGASWLFTPDRAGRFRLDVGIVHVGIHEVFVRVEDPERRDGVRARGY